MSFLQEKGGFCESGSKQNVQCNGPWYMKNDTPDSKSVQQPSVYSAETHHAEVNPTWKQKAEAWLCKVNLKPVRVRVGALLPLFPLIGWLYVHGYGCLCD